ncbi:glycosyltransferase family 39 protein [Microbacterium atlanticum]|uniref:glycosyltransferase family 39 protein n=1 Tax=Microbacterium atlanticum TaxID=2782168 RepID=UPI001888AF9B|nr:hypothetical protein [Microbacterium atlanticum]
MPTLTTPVRGRRELVAMAAVVVAFACAVRLAWLDRQSYWVDEQWSVGVASLPLADSLHTIKTEVHPPVYQLLLWAWVHLGGTDAAWTRALSTAFGLLGVFLAYWLLRRSELDLRLRLLIVAGSAAAGMAIVYAQEARSYSLLWCCALAVTALTIRLTAACPHQPQRGLVAGWVLWGAALSATHLFGALLLVVAGAVALGWRRLRPSLITAMTGLAVAPQLLWQIWGVFTPQFGGATSWIPRPASGELAELATTLFSVDGLEMTDGGFAWRSWAGVVFCAVVATILWSLSYRGGAPSAVDVGPRSSARDAATTLLLIAIVVTVLAWTVSQFVHVWTLRNLIVILPAATWGVIAALFAVAARARLESVFTAFLLACLAANLGWVAANLQAPYKTDFDAVSRYLDAERRADPDALFVGNFTPNWLLSSGLPTDRRYREWLMSPSVQRDAADLATLETRPGVTVYTYWVGSGDGVEDAAEVLLSQASSHAECERLPIFGLVVVRCESPHVPGYDQVPTEGDRN